MRRRHGSRAATAAATSGAYLCCLLFTALTAGGGCVSNEYRISRDELQRLAQAPVETRGGPVHVVQELGSRRADEVAPPPQDELQQAWRPVYVESQAPIDAGGDGADLDLDLRLDGPGRQRTGLSVRPRGLHRPLAGRGGAASGRVAPTSRGHSGGGGGVGDIFGGGGGGGGGGDASALVVVAIVAVAVAGIVAVGLVASEGARYQGPASMAPQQTVYVEYANNTFTGIPLEDLRPSDLVHATGAIVKDDEGYGLALGPRDPLGRRGGAFGLELGATSFNLGKLRSAGPAAEIQVGGFFHQRWGLMLDVGVSGGDVAVGGTATALASAADMTTIVTRHHLALELQAFPASLGPLHVGLFARAGGALVGGPDGVQGGPLAGGGAMLQLALTSRLALVVRGGVDNAHLDGGWSTAARLTGGVAVY